MAIFTVTNLNDSGAGSLREALTLALGSAGADEIVFQTGLRGTISLGSGLRIAHDVTIDGDTDGDNKADITLDGNDNDRVLLLFDVATDVALHSLNITGGDAGSANGGGILASFVNSLTIVDSTISGNNANLGGGIFAGGSDVTLVNSLITDNKAGLDGGGAYFSSSSTAELTNVTVQGNNATTGGGLFVAGPSTATINSSTISGNTALYGGGINNNGTLTLANTVVAGNNTEMSPVDDDVQGTITTANYSFLGSTETITNVDGHNINGGGNAGLGPLADNGGTTKTLAILQGSALIGAGDAGALPRDMQDLDGDGSTIERLPVDATGLGRVQGQLDIGATEFRGSLVVDTLSDIDDGDYGQGRLSLREALQLVTDGGTISFDQSISGFNSGGSNSGLILLDGTELQITGDVTIDGDVNGDGKADITLDGGNASRVLLLTGAGTDVALKSLTIKGGDVMGSGGGIYANEINSLLITDTTISGNSGLNGGGISTRGTDLTMVNTLIAENKASFEGGGVNFSFTNTATLNNVTVQGNDAGLSGGGISVSGVTSATIYNSTISGNLANATGKITTFGGGIDNNYGDVSLINTVVAGNTSGGELSSPVANDVGGYINYAAHSFIGSSEFFVNDGGGNLNGGGDAGLGLLADNGGTTQTLAILQGSALIGAGDARLLPLDAQDMDGDGDRSEPLPVEAGGLARVQGPLDIGATEFRGILQVDTLSDIDDGDYGPGNLSLREALQLVTDGGTISFDQSITGGMNAGVNDGVIVLGGTQLVISRDVTIDGDVDGDNKADITLDGDNASRVLLLVQMDTDVALKSLNITNGNTGGSSSGGGIAANFISTLSIADSTISGNSADFGGGINARGTDVTMVNTLITGNSATFDGGGVRVIGTSAELTNVTIHGNRADELGGGLTIRTSATATISNSTISGNVADADGSSTGFGGGISNDSSIVTLENTVVAGNSSGGTLPTAAANDVVGSITTAANSFIGTSATIDTDNGGNINGGGDARLGALADNGGTTQTLALLAGSQLIGAGNAALLPLDALDIDGDGDTTEPLPQDATGRARILDALDIGAVELQDLLRIGTELAQVQSYDPTGQDQGTAASDADARAITLTGNAWKYVAVDAQVGADTVLAFTFNSADLGESTAIGFDTDTALSFPNDLARFIELGGDGSLTGNMAATPGYRGGNQLQRYEINLGGLIAAGSYANLVLFADDDADGSGIARFADIEIFERAPFLVDGMALRPESYDPAQDFGTARGTPGGTALTLSDNAWKSFELGATLTADSWLTVTVDSDDTGELFGIGFDTDQTLTPDRLLQLGGGDTFNALEQGFNSYVAGSGARVFDIPVGALFGPGSAQQLVLFADDDADGSGSVTFSGIELVEGPPLAVNGTLRGVQSYDPAGQDAGSATPDTAAGAITLTGNAWKYVEVDAQVGADTVLAFTFNSADLGESTAIGFDTDTALSFPNDLARFIELGGDGSLTGNMAATPGYRGGNLLQRYEINLGGLIAAGSYANLVLFADDDADGSGIARFADIEIFERAPFLVDGMALRPESYDPAQDFGTARGTPGGTALTLSDNAWKSFELGATLTADSWLTVTVDSDDTGELFGIGFDTDQTLTPDRLLQLGGGDTFNALEQGFNSYVAGSGARVFDIPVGALFGPGSAQQLVLFADDDADGSGSVTFSGIELVEGPPLRVGGATFGLTGHGTQDAAGSSVTQTEDGRGVTLAGNAWKSAQIGATLTADTVLSFDFASSDAGELALIGFDNSAAFTSSDAGRFFKIAGTDSLNGVAGALGYSGNGSFESFEVDVGALAGQAARLVLAVDDDADASGVATFRDVELLRTPFSASVTGHGGSQDQGVVREFLEGGTLKLTDNAWKAILTDALEVDADTVLHFEFRSDVEGEIMGIGLAASTALANDSFWQLSGVQSLGAQAQNGAYEEGDGWQRFSIDVGATAPGTYDRLVLAADDDRPTAPGDAYFRDIHLTGLGQDDFDFQIL